MNDEPLEISAVPSLSIVCQSCGDTLQLANGHHFQCRCRLLSTRDWTIHLAPVGGGTHRQYAWDLLFPRTRQDIEMGHRSCRCFRNRPQAEQIWLCQYHQGFQGCQEREGALVEHAERELTLIGWLNGGDHYADLLARCILGSIEAFSEVEGGAHMVVPVVTKLLRCQPLAPLTDNPDEWLDRSDIVNQPLWQSIRDTQSFSNDAGKTCYRMSEDGTQMTLPAATERCSPG